ncbi:MAG: hypothetical protein MR009_06920 [Sutterellaceae bacterium]|nr:hypothetical protein [Sutterellaceae bacterium]MDD7442843.1 hypothetical protein [Sutterellaceae bacterium]MDY2868679.1 hypothetical protein [Mesosutterella sp.]
MPEGRRVTVPAEISLHGLGHPESGKSTGFRGAGVRSREDLPDWLVAGPLVEFRSGDEAGFPGGFFGKDRGKEGWDAVWRGEDDGARLEVSWDPGFGWSIATTFLGDMVQNAFGYRSLPFGRAFQMGTAGMTGRISRALGKIGVPAFTGDGPDLSFLPDGMFLHVAVPVAGNRLRETEAWAERPHEGIARCSFATLRLLGVDFTRRAGPGEEAVPNPFRVIDRTGLPFRAPPELADGVVTEHGYGFVADIVAPFAEIPALVRAVRSEPGTPFEASPFVLSVLRAETGEPVLLRSDTGQSARWFLRGGWLPKERLPDTAAADREKGFEAVRLWRQATLGEISRLFAGIGGNTPSGAPK